VALQDTKGDGHADVIRRFGPGVESGNAGGTGIALYKGALYVETNDRIVRYALPPGAITPSRDPDVIVSGLPLTGDHPMQEAILLKSRFQEEQKWAAKGVIELIFIRNASCITTRFGIKKRLKNWRLRTLLNCRSLGRRCGWESTTSFDTDAR
jgi:hypothetical protein